jgi:serine/threonine protein kinase
MFSQNSNEKDRLAKIHYQSNILIEKMEEYEKNSFEAKYVIGKKLGEGMHAAVYQCFEKSDEAKETPFAVKISREDDEEKKMAHKKEFEITNKLKHKNIIRSIEIFDNELKGEIHQVMEYVDGIEVLD